MSISFSSFASTAFETARSTFKAMAEAAVPPADGAPASSPAAGVSVAVHRAAREAVIVYLLHRVGDLHRANRRVLFTRPGQRRVGTLLDALA